MTTVQLPAWSETTALLTASQAEAASQSGLVQILIDEPPSKWRLVSGSRVGVVHLEGWDLQVVPKLDIPKLMFLLSYAADPSGWRDIGPAFAAETDLFAAVAAGFAVHAERAISPAPIHGYVTVEEQAMTLRGRLRVADQIARWPGLPIPLEISHDEYTPDVAENQLLRGAAELLLRVPLVPALARKRLLRIRATLEDVRPTPPGPAIEAPPITRLNTRYAGALALAQLILRSTSISTVRGKTSSVAFVFDMNTVFEDFLSTALRTSLQRHGGRVVLQHRREHLDEERRIRLIPDITWWRGAECWAVLDAKYKPLDDARFPNADAYQMLAYCTALELDRGYLVYAKDAIGKDRSHHVRNSGPRIEVRSVDVERGPSQVLRQVQRLADEVALVRHGAATGHV